MAMRHESNRTYERRVMIHVRNGTSSMRVIVFETCKALGIKVMDMRHESNGT